MAVNGNPTIRRRRLGAELRRLRLARGLTSTQVAQHLLISQPKVSHLENGRRAISPRDIRDLCGLYQVTDQQIIDSLMEMARESNRQGWWVACGEVPYGVYIGMETAAATVRSYEPLVIPGLLQTPAYASAVTAETIPLATEEQIAVRLEVRLCRQSRVHHPARSFRLEVVLDESALRRVVGSPEIMSEQLEYLNRLGEQPHIAVQVLPHGAGAHPGILGQFSILDFPDSDTGTVYLERFTSDLYLEKRSDVRYYGAMFDRIQTRALTPEHTRRFITRVIQELPAATALPVRR
ncbi:helix-turn-helix domain-containing protein [Streptomyces erythrochromogenes]|uniref:helix-turn-helix domain-containing protein n=1 Tax=Streptomyces erythrochromogenes TaxID=285574 RepID=UPI0038040532